MSIINNLVSPSLALFTGGFVGVFIEDVLWWLRIQADETTYNEFREYVRRRLPGEIVDKVILYAMTSPMISIALMIFVSGMFSMSSLMATTLWVFIMTLYYMLYIGYDRSVYYSFVLYSFGLLAVTHLTYNETEPWANVPPSIYFMSLGVGLRMTNTYKSYEYHNDMNISPSFIQHILWEPCIVASYMTLALKKSIINA